MGKESALQCRDVIIPGRGTKTPRAEEQLSPCATTRGSVCRSEMCINNTAKTRCVQMNTEKLNILTGTNLLNKRGTDWAQGLQIYSANRLFHAGIIIDTSLSACEHTAYTDTPGLGEQDLLCLLNYRRAPLGVLLLQTPLTCVLYAYT